MNQATQLSRRQFLKLSAATVGAAALAGSMPRLAGASGGSSTDDAKRGAQLYDRWYAVLGVSAPDGDMPIWARQTTNTRSGPETWRCAECHGWDYMGVRGVYGSGSHFTGFPSVKDAVATLDHEEIVSHLRGEKDPGHDFSAYLSEPDMYALAAFLKSGLIDDEMYINPVTLRVRGGDLEHGRTLFESTCLACHGANGDRLIFRTEGYDETLGALADRDPYRFLHRSRFGVAGTDMPVGFDLGWTVEDGRDVLLYVQTLPTGQELDALAPAGQSVGPNDPLGGPASDLWTGILTGMAAFLGTIGGSLLFLGVLIVLGVLVVAAMRRRA